MWDWCIQLEKVENRKRKVEEKEQKPQINSPTHCEDIWQC